MKKILLSILMITGLMAEPYLGVGGMISDKQESCRVYGIALVGYKINDKFSIEGRYSHILRSNTHDVVFILKR